jgi:hypothetical protein
LGRFRANGASVTSVSLFASPRVFAAGEEPGFGEFTAGGAIRSEGTAVEVGLLGALVRTCADGTILEAFDDSGAWDFGMLTGAVDTATGVDGAFVDTGIACGSAGGAAGSSCVEPRSSTRTGVCVLPRMDHTVTATHKPTKAPTAKAILCREAQTPKRRSLPMIGRSSNNGGGWRTSFGLGSNRI